MFSPSMFPINPPDGIPIIGYLSTPHYPLFRCRFKCPNQFMGLLLCTKIHNHNLSLNYYYYYCGAWRFSKSSVFWYHIAIGFSTSDTFLGIGDKVSSNRDILFSASAILSLMLCISCLISPISIWISSILPVRAALLKWMAAISCELTCFSVSLACFSCFRLWCAELLGFQSWWSTTPRL